jgi:Gpi18-like mannosyltransferase
LKNRTFLALFCGMFLFEAILALWTGHPYDMNVWFQTGAWMNQGINIYQPANHLGYPPLWALWCFVAYHAFLFFSSNLEIWRLIVKIPIILSHLVCAYLAGLYASNRFGQKTGAKILLIVLTWSFFIYTGAIWGQIDTISVLLTFTAFYAAVTKRTATSAILLGLAIGLKLYPIVVLPAFLIYILKNWNKKEATKYFIYAVGVPFLLTMLIFGAFQWNPDFFVKTILYSTPANGINPTQINFGCMNFFSFLYLFKLSFVSFSFTLWIPLLFICGIYWLRKPKFGESTLILSIISFYLLFMISYGWITEQTFLDPSIFIILFIFCYNPKKTYLYCFVVIQIFVYIFTVANQTLTVFNPLLEKFSPSSAIALQNFYSGNFGPLINTIRGTMGLVVSLSLMCFLILLLRPSIIEKTKTLLNRKGNLGTIN